MREPVLTGRPGWRLSRKAFDALLESLDPDRGRAGERYEVLRRKLQRFFEWRGVCDADAQADETLNRVARRLEQGEAIRDVSCYTLGVARLVWLEASKRQGIVLEVDDRTEAAPVDAEDEQSAARLDCLDACLDTLPRDQRDLVLAYFEQERGAKIDHRKQIAARMGIEINALRIRVHRIRAKLERCVKGCVLQRERQ